MSFSVRVAEEWYESDGSNPSCLRGLELARENRQQLETEQVRTLPYIYVYVNNKIIVLILSLSAPKFIDSVWLNVVRRKACLEAVLWIRIRKDPH